MTKTNENEAFKSFFQDEWSFNQENRHYMNHHYGLI
jgi:hypothetical protein